MPDICYPPSAIKSVNNHSPAYLIKSSWRHHLAPGHSLALALACLYSHLHWWCGFSWECWFHSWSSCLYCCFRAGQLKSAYSAGCLWLLPTLCFRCCLCWPCGRCELFGRGWGILAPRTCSCCWRWLILERFSGCADCQMGGFGDLESVCVAGSDQPQRRHLSPEWPFQVGSEIRCYC